MDPGIITLGLDSQFAWKLDFYFSSSRSDDLENNVGELKNYRGEDPLQGKIESLGGPGGLQESRRRRYKVKWTDIYRRRYKKVT